MNKQYLWVVAAVVLYGCGSDGDGGTTVISGNDDNATIQGLEMPKNMSIVSAKMESATSAFDGFSGAKMGAKDFSDAGTDYSGDIPNTYVYDTSMESLETVNMILCLMAQTGATHKVNQGAYIALVDEDKCEQGQNQSSAGQTGQSSGGNNKQFNKWTINSTRASNNDPQIVKIWVPGRPHGDGPSDPMDEQIILVEVTVNAAPGASNPFGDFVMNFKGVVDAALFGGQQGVEMETMRGTLQTVANEDGLPQFRFINLGGDSLNQIGAGFGFEEAVNVIMSDAAGNGGRAITRLVDTFDDGHGVQSLESSFAIAFDADHLARGKDADGDDQLDVQQCLSRSDFNTHVWRYNLYHHDDTDFNGAPVVEGQRVALNSGFPFSYDSDANGSEDAHGWIGYHGLWTENGQLEDGAVIHKYDYASGNSEAFVVNVSAGKLVRRTAEQELLSSFQGDEFQFWGQHPTLNIFDQWLVSVDENNAFAIIAHMQWGENGPEVSETVDHDQDSNTAEVAVAANLTLLDGTSLWLWSDALGGNVVYVHENAVAANQRKVTFYGEEFVIPGDALLAQGNVTLYCYERCLKGGLNQNDINNANSDQDLYHQYNNTPFLYTLSAAHGKVSLIDASNGQAVSAGDLDMRTLGYDWGINTGEMLSSPLMDPMQPWRVYDQEVSYRWETGPNDWNVQVTVTDSNNDVASFDSPLRFTYTHSTANDANGNTHYNNKKFMLEYGGPGDLWGFPWVEDNENHRWYAAVTLADGTQLSSGGQNFIVKAIEQEQTMQIVADGECAAFELDAVLSDPDLVLPIASAIGTVSFSLADKPAVNAAPAVIEGELQDSFD